jgi:xanthine/CO dehydrogenase XdhC/CoxF family maturation factor
MIMPEPKNLLETIEDCATRGDHIAIVRALNPGSGKSATVMVSHGELLQPLADRKLADQVLGSVENLAARGGVADLVDAVDEQGSPVSLAIEIIKPKLELLIFGAGHVGQAVALVGALIGYDVTVVDDREEFASRKRLPDSRISLLVSDYASAAGKLTISSGTAVVIVTRGHQYDELCLKSVVRSNAHYIGMIGSRKRVLSVFKKLVDEGASERDLQRVHAPIGLRIGARSPQEIAVSILAEIIDHVNNPDHEHKGEGNGI